MATIRIGLLCMDDLPHHAQPVLGDYPELYAHLLRRQPIELVIFAAHRGELPSSLDGFDGWMLGGGRRSVFEDEAWIRDAEDFVRAASAAERPIVGMCFGHQLVASALGGRVDRSAAGWGLGAVEYSVSAATSWFEDDRLTLIASHQDQVTELPDGASVWASAPYCPIAGMTIADHVWTVQGHPEFTAGIADALYSGRAGVLSPETIERARSSLACPLSNDAVAAAITEFVRR